MTKTVQVLAVGLAAICLAGICLGLYQAQADSSAAAPSGQKGAAMNSSLINPLTVDGLEDGIFPAAAEAALNGPAGTVPSVARIGEASIEVPVAVNGFTLDSSGHLLVEDGEPFEADYSRIAPIHPYFLKSGENEIRAQGGGGAIAVTLWDYVHGAQNNELLRITLPAGAAQSFVWKSEIPQRPWETSARIEADAASKQQLYTAMAGLHAKLRALSDAASDQEATADSSSALKKDLLETTRAFVEASELRGKPYRLIDQMLEAATVRARPGDPAGSLELRDFPPADELELEVLAGGRLARLKHNANDTPFAFISNLPDGPRRQTGTTVLEFDAWYRLNNQGKWELDALFPRKAPGTWTNFEVGPYELEDLFRLSNF